MRATFKLLNSYFWKTVYGPVIAFLLPVLLLAILGNIMRIQYVYPGIIAMTLMFIGILALPLSIMELKSSSLFKYIGASPVDNKKFSIVAIGYYIFIAVLSAITIMVATMAIFPKDVFPSTGFKFGILGGIFNTVAGASSFYIATGIHLFMVIAFGLVIATFSKTPQQALTLAICIIIPSMFLSGMILSVDIIAKSEVMQWISRFVPFRYTTGNIVVASTPLTQVGDVLQLLSVNEKQIIFNGVQSNGVIKSAEFINGAWDDKVEISTSKDLMHYIELNKGDYKSFTFIKDKYLFEKILFISKGTELEMVPASDNNIFDWVQSFGVRRIPDINQIKEFIQRYLSDKFGDNGSGEGTAGVLDGIRTGNFSWMNLFLNQNMTLYTITDRVLNIVLPIGATVGSLWYVSKNFKWSAR